jgi:hypothetical protein
MLRNRRAATGRDYGAPAVAPIADWWNRVVVLPSGEIDQETDVVRGDAVGSSGQRSLHLSRRGGVVGMRDHAAGVDRCDGFGSDVACSTAQATSRMN